jgi:preprotein translocase subunit SecA
MSEKLKKKGVPHTVLNAKHHQAEAQIVANAGQKGAVTISTNMAGRGTDIVLGEGVIELGGLHILGTSRHESRRIDNQLRGRSGRQGDPGTSRFYLSLEDDLLRIFGGDRIHAVMDKLGIEEGEHIEHRFISKAIENAQSKVEGHNFEIRKHLLEYDDVMNQQREVIYQQRRKALVEESLRPLVMEMVEDKIYDIVDEFALEKTPVLKWDLDGMKNRFRQTFNYNPEIEEAAVQHDSAQKLSEFLFENLSVIYDQREASFGEAITREIERHIVLQTVDTRWKEHLLSMDHLKEGIGLRGYAQQDPLRIYRKEGFEMFQGLMERVKEEIVEILYKIQISSPSQVDNLKKKEQQNLTFSHSDSTNAKQPVKRSSEKIQRNDPCPCGSGKKYKKCCGV